MTEYNNYISDCNGKDVTILYENKNTKTIATEPLSVS